MKKIAIVVFATALSLGAAACSKKKADTTPANSTETSGDMNGAMGGDAYGGDAYGNPCGDANPCGM